MFQSLIAFRFILLVLFMVTFSFSLVLTRFQELYDFDEEVKPRPKKGYTAKEQTFTAWPKIINLEM